MTKLISPDGREYRTGNLLEISRLVNGRGYRLADDAFDPSKHDVKTVQKHLADHPDDAERVLAAERDGQARVGILGKSDEE